MAQVVVGTVAVRTSGARSERSNRAVRGGRWHHAGKQAD